MGKDSALAQPHGTSRWSVQSVVNERDNEAGQEGRILAFAALSRRSGVPFIRWAYETDNEAGQEGRILAFAAPRCWTKP